MNDLKGIIEDCNKSDLVSDRVIKKIIEIIGHEEWQDLHDENNDICTTMGELIITLKGIADLEKENAKLKCECRRCIHTDCPCVLSDYGKDRNGICDHFKDVFDENAELKKKNLDIQDAVTMQMYTNKANKEIADRQLTKAKKLIRDFISVAIDYIDKEDKNYSYIVEAEQFLNSEVEK